MANVDIEMQEPFDPSEMTLMSHLDEFRIRLTRAALSVVVTTLFTFLFAPQLVVILAVPLDTTIVNADGTETFVRGIDLLRAIDVTENITVFMRVALMGGMILSMPMIIYQLIAFIVPGLTPQEKRVLYTGLPAATLLFLGGVAFSYYVILPTAVPFLMQFLGIQTDPRPSTYFGFVTRLIFWVGASFEMPLILGLLARLGVLSPQFLITNARYAVVIIAIAAALITPTPDPLNMGLVMAPLLILYGVGILLAKWLYQPRDIDFS